MFVLIHGAYHAAWCWQPLLELFSDMGENAIAPDLPGHGRSPGWIGDQDMDNYVAATIAAIEAASDPVTLVGHSMAGGVVAAVAEATPKNLARVLFLAAYIPADGEAISDLTRKDQQSLVRAEHVDIEGIDAIVPKSGNIGAAFLSDGTEKQVRWAEDRVQMQSATPFRQKITLSANKFGKMSKTAIICSEDKAISADLQRWMAARAGCDPVIEMKSGHSPFVTKPGELCELLIALKN